MVGTWGTSSVSSEDILFEENFKNLFEKQPWLVRHSFTPEYWPCKEQVIIDIFNNNVIPTETSQVNINKRKYHENSEPNVDCVNNYVSWKVKQCDLYKKIRVLSDLDDKIYNPQRLSSNPSGEFYSFINNDKKFSETSQLPIQFVNLRLQSTPIASLSTSSGRGYPLNQQSSSTFSTQKNQSSASSSNIGQSLSTKNGSSEILSSFKIPFPKKECESTSKMTSLNIFNFEQTIYDPHFNPLLWNQELVDRLTNNGWFDKLFYSSKSKSLLRDNALWNHYIFENLSLSTKDSSTLTVLFLSNSLVSSLNYIIDILQKKGITCNMKKVEFGSKSIKKNRNYHHSYDIEERKSVKGKGKLVENNEVKSKLPTISSTQMLYLIFPQESDQDIMKFQSKSVRLFLKKFSTINKIHIWETRDDCIINFENLYNELRLTRELETKLYQVKRHYWNHMNPLKEWKIMNSIVNCYNRKIESLSKMVISNEVGSMSNEIVSMSNEVGSMSNEVGSMSSEGRSKSKIGSFSNISSNEFSETFMDTATQLSKDNSSSEYEQISLSLKIQHSLIFFKEDVVEKLARMYPPTSSSIFKNNWKIKCPYVLLQPETECFELKNISEALNDFSSPCGGIGTIVHMSVVSKAVIQGRFYGLKVQSTLIEDWWLMEEYRTLPEYYIRSEHAARRPFILMLAYDMNVVDWSIVNLPSIVYDEIEWENIPHEKQIFVEGYIGVKFEIYDYSEIQEIQEHNDEE
ncbi:1660_t:CDS:1 [Diversispora eburnea]|uniref:1660_t:CDS:1 n=1 Tax=Diversispora eburnea TaxID=1213867 RepID=A0A9N8W9K7_9GLOM|nr:1660_t:CDS:1 [Diversispora eburnea]